MTDFNDRPISEATIRVLESFASREGASVDEIISLARALPKVLAGIEHRTMEQQSLSLATDETRTMGVPAVPVSESFTQDAVTCLCCGRSFTMLKRHLRAEHGLSENDYRERFGLDADHPLVAPSYSIRKAEYAKKAGLGRYTREDSLEHGAAQ